MDVDVSAASHVREITPAQEEVEDEDEDEVNVDDLSDTEAEPTDADRLSEYEFTLIKYMEGEDMEGLCKWLKMLPEDDSVATPFKTILHYINVQDEQNFIGALIQALSTDAEPPLHKLACRNAFRLTALFLDHGLDPHIKFPVFIDGFRFKELALPLFVALKAYFTFNWIRYMCAFDNDNAALRLISYLSRGAMIPRIETARLLASKTKEVEIDQIIIDCMKKGRVLELCMLMLLGYHSKVSSMMYYCCDDPTSKKIMEQLADIFERIGDKLVYYVKLQGLKGVNTDKVIIDVASLLNDAGYQVTSKDILPRELKHRHFFKEPFLGRKSCTGIGKLAVVQCFCIVRVFKDLIKGFLYRDASSISESRQLAKVSYVSNNFMKPIRYHGPPFLFRTLWRATKFS